MTRSTLEPGYVSLQSSGELARRAGLAAVRLSECDLCAQECGADRSTERGECHTGTEAIVSSHHTHLGEEASISGWRGSGTIFFTQCNLKCRFCSNYEISMLGQGRQVEPREIARMMLELEGIGCHNINFVSPSHVVPMILSAVDIAAAAGLTIPLVYNTGGYDSVKTLELLDGVIDIYMPDMKYFDDEIGEKYTGARNYPTVNRAAVKEMHRQVGDLTLDEEGIATRGLLVRHLVMPDGVAGTAEIARFLVEEISTDTYVNVMAQYRPAFHSCESDPLDRPTTIVEYEAAVEIMRSAGLHRLDP